MVEGGDMKKTRLTDQEIRLGALIASGLTAEQADLYIEAYPKPTSFVEAAVILEVRVKEAVQSCREAMRHDSLRAAREALKKIGSKK